jgi:ATP-binding cassette subfamily B protein
MGFIQSWILLHVTSRISIALISDFIAKMLNLPMQFFGSKSKGDIIQRIGDHSRIQSFFTGTTLGVAFSFVNFFVFGSILAYYNLTMLLIFLVGHAFYVTWVMLFLKIRRELDYKSFEKSARNQSNIIELITGAEEIKLSGAEQKMRNKWEWIQADLFKLGVRKLKISQVQSTGAFFLSNITNISLSALSAYLVVSGEITLGMMISLSYILGQLSGPISSFIGFVHSLQDAKISIERLGEVHFQKDENQDNEFKVSELPSGERDIYIKNLSFSYMGDKVPPVLKNMVLPFFVWNQV